MYIYTIGFTKKTAEEFFEAIKEARIERLVDVRLKNTSALAGFARAAHLPYLLREVCEVSYLHEPLLAPTADMLDAYKKKQLRWENYVRNFTRLLRERKPERSMKREDWESPTVLLCSEPEPDRCHRRLVAEYLAARWKTATVVHL